MKKTNLWLSLTGVAGAVSFLVYLLLYNRIYRWLGDFADNLIFVPILVVLVIFLVGLWRIFYHSSRNFSPKLFWPVAVTVSTAVVIFVLSTTITNFALDQSFSNNETKMYDLILKLGTHEIIMEPGLNTLPQPYENVVPSGEMMIYETEGQDAYLFLTLDHTARLEGFMYLPEGMLRYEILNQYAEYEYEEMEDGWIWVCFYK